ncbi:MAG: class I SAM-dependent methyltransferase [Acidimicrobiia bacterium]
MNDKRKRAVIFGKDAHRYDRARPSYPAPLVDDLVALGGHEVLDVGCGTGKAGRLLAASGFDVLGVEPDRRMADVARAHGLAVEESTFEAWDPAGRGFDLVVSGQAWHWVDPLVGPAKAGDVLDGRGWLALFWNGPEYDQDVRRRLDEVYEQVVPQMAPGSKQAKEAKGDGTAGHVAAIESSGRFASVEVQSYGWSWVGTAAEYCDKLATHSDHILLPREQREMLLRRVGEVIAPAGGRLAIDYTTTLILAGRGGAS